jgi:hypothetical protein
MKAYNTLHGGGALEIMENYDVGPMAIRLLRNFWNLQQLMVRQRGYHSNPFSVDRGVTQGDTPSPTIFNMVVDKIVRYWTAQLLEDTEAEIGGGSGWTKIASIFYADDGAITSHDADLTQQSINLLVNLFQRMNLGANTIKTTSMVCLPSSVQDHISRSAYDMRILGE